MPIKKSSLEKNLAYRIAKVFFLIVPILAAIYAFWKGYIKIEDIFNKDIANIISKNAVLTTCVIVGVIAYYVVLRLVWRIILYIFFGGLEDDTRKATGGAVNVPGPAGQQGALSPDDKKEVGFLIFLLVMVGLIYYIYTYQTPGPQPYIPGPNPAPTCIPTGCGNLWRSSCTNKCYQTNADCQTASREKCGSFTCRQCP